MKLNKPTYLLILLIEECAEVIHRACKAIRFGLDEIEPGTDPAVNNVERLNYEMNDLTAVFFEVSKLDTRFAPRQHLIDEKREKVETFMGYSREIGTLEEEEKYSRDWKGHSGTSFGLHYPFRYAYGSAEEKYVVYNFHTGDVFADGLESWEAGNVCMKANENAGFDCGADTAAIDSTP